MNKFPPSNILQYFIYKWGKEWIMDIDVVQLPLD